MLKQFFLSITFLLFINFLAAQTVSFSSTWKFKTGDDPAWKNADFNDTDWKTIQVPAYWEAAGFAGYDGFAWYRTTFSVPDNMLKQPCVLLAGIIDDADETYINGVLIGHTGKFPPNDQSAWDTPRKYDLPAGILKTQNTLAIRVFDGAVGGGIYSGPISLITRKQYEKERQARLKSQHSYHQITTSNGLIAAVYNDESNKVENVYPHIFSAYDSALYVQPFVSNISPNVVEKPLAIYYLKNTHVIEVKYRHFVINYTASFSNADKIFYAVVRGNPADIAAVSFSNDAENGLEKQSITRQFGKKAEKYFLFGFTDKHHPNSGMEKAINRLKSAPVSLIDTEVDFMQQVVARCRFPKKINRAERDLLEQSVAVLKMSQVHDNEVFPLAKGQILASLRPGVWAISWVRDAAFAIAAMTKLGLYDEAKKGLEFMLNASPSNQYKHYIHTDGKDYGIGVDYQISVTRYFGNGREESDFDYRGPNIEIDDFGLFLIALSDYVQTSGDADFYRKWQSVLQTKVADAIIHTINAQNIIRADSGPWEHHLPGRSFVFTAAVCSVGLDKFAALQQRYGFESATYFAAAKRLYEGVMANMLYENRLIKGNAQDQVPTDHYFFDGATFELFANGFITDKALFLSHIQAYDQELRVKTGQKMGYIRFNSEDSYENQEWPFASMRVAVAQTIFGNRSEAKRLMARVTQIAGRNYHLIPEIISLEEEAYKGAIPMVGYGAGAYVLGVWRVYE